MLLETLARLCDQATALKHVAGAAELAALKQSPPRHLQPAAYIVPLAETPEPNPLVGATRQRVVAEIGIVLVVSGERADNAGGAAAIAIKDVRDQVMAALLGWVPAAGHGAFEFAGGALLRFADQSVWWQDNFATDFYIRKV